jgi:hypothetical protein
MPIVATLPIWPARRNDVGVVYERKHICSIVINSGMKPLLAMELCSGI